MIATDKQDRGPVRERWMAALSRDGVIVGLVALGWGLFLILAVLVASRQYGFHRDELAFLDNGQHLAWGYVEYPPLVPFVAHIAMALFGLSTVGVRLFPILGSCLILVLTARMARELGGSRQAQVIAGLAVVTAPVLLFDAIFLSYETFDILWWVLSAYLMIRLLTSENPRWWLAIGAAIGLGLLTKYTMAFAALGIAAGVLLTPARRYLKSPWLWAGIALAVGIVLPNLVWQAQHGWIGLRFTASIHARDIAIGRTNVVQFLAYQFFACTNILAVGLWISGFWFVARRPEGQRYRALAWMAAVPFGLFLILQGRFYYTAPIYAMLIAAGSSQRVRPVAGSGRQAIWAWMRRYGWPVAVGLLQLAFFLPFVPVNTPIWRAQTALVGEYVEEIGWPELVQTVAGIRDALPVSEQGGVGILTGNYGEAAAIDLLGPAYQLPQAISGTDTYWLRGYGSTPPQTLIVLGLDQGEVDRIFQQCELAGHTSNRYGVRNEETRDHPDIFVCHELRVPWQEFWRYFQSFG